MKLKDLKPFTRLDDFLMNKVFTPIGHHWEYKTGKTPFKLAWGGFGVSLVGFCGSAYCDAAAHEWAGLFINGVCCLVTGLQASAAERADKENRGRIMTRYSPQTGPLLYQTAFSGKWRVFWALLSCYNTLVFCTEPLSLASLSLLFTSAGSMCAWYFCGVQRPPPKPRREEVDVRGMVPIHERS